jgi:long-subunit fatty acid transport protein
MPCLCFLFISFTARSEDRIHVHLDYNQLFGFHENYKYWSASGFNHSLSGFDLGITGMYTVNRRLSAGAGVALGRLHNPGRTYIPVYATLHYAPFTKSVRPYLFVKAGHLAGTKISETGTFFSTGAGYKIKFREHFGLNFTLGYHFVHMMHEIRIYNATGSDGTFIYLEDAGINRSAAYRHSVALGAGFIF